MTKLTNFLALRLLRIPQGAQMLSFSVSWRISDFLVICVEKINRQRRSESIEGLCRLQKFNSTFCLSLLDYKNLFLHIVCLDLRLWPMIGRCGMLLERTVMHCLSSCSLVHTLWSREWEMWSWNLELMVLVSLYIHAPFPAIQ